MLCVSPPPFLRRFLRQPPLHPTPHKGCNRRWGRHSRFWSAVSVQLLESQAGCGGSKFLSVKPQSFRKQDLLKPLFLNEIEFHPKARGVRDDVLGEGQDTVDVELIEDRVIQLDLSESQLFAKLVPLALIGLSVNRTLMQECFIDTVETLPLLADNVLQVSPQRFDLVLPVLPHVQDDRVLDLTCHGARVVVDVMLGRALAGVDGTARGSHPWSFRHRHRDACAST